MTDVTHHMKLAPEPFKRMFSGEKIVEVRLNDNKRKKLKYGDLIVFAKLPDIEERRTIRIIGLHKFKSFKELLKRYSMKDFGYSKDYSKKEFLEGLYKYYSREDELKYGVLAIEIEHLGIENKNIKFK